MNKSKKLTAAVAASAVASAVVAPAAFAATTFTDINDSYAKAAIEELVAAGILNGKGDGKFDPSGKIERQDFAIILAKALDLKVEAPATATFKDVPKDHYSFGYVEAAAKAKLISGMGDGTFGAGKELTRQDMAVLFVRALSYATGYNAEGKASKLAFKDNDAIATYAKDAVGAAVELGLVSGNPDGTFNPAGNAQRQAVALVASKFLKVADKATITEATFVDKNTVTVKFDKAVDLKKEDIAVAVKATKAAVEVKEVVAAADKKSATVKVADLAAGTTYTLTFNGKTVELSTPAVALAVSKVKAVSNTKVEVTLAAAVTAVDASAFSIKDAAGAAVEVKGAALSADGKSVIVTTAAQTAYAAYSLTANGVTKTFVGFPVDTVKPTVTTNTTADFQTFMIKFSERVDAASATNIANYTVDNNLTVLKATLSADGTEVWLTTAPQTVGTIYKVTVANVADLSGNVVESVDKLFGGVAKDTSAQTVTTVTATAYNQVTVDFGKNVDVASATNIANYAIDNNLTVLKAEVSAADASVVILTTADQVVGTIYKVTTSNVKDYLGNALAAADTKYFGGMFKDTTAPAVTTLSSSDNNKITINFDRAVTAETATNVANYAVDNNLVVVSAELLSNGSTVVLTTAPQTVGQLYKINVKGVKTALSTEMAAKDFFFGGQAKDVTGPTVTTVTAIGDGKVTLAFDQTVDKDIAEVLTNYSFDGGLGYPVDAVVAPDFLSVTLTGAAQTPGKIYNVTVANVADQNGNALVTTNSANVKSFVGKGTAAVAKVNALGSVVVNNNTIDLLFDTELNLDATALNNLVAGLTVKNGATTVAVDGAKAWVTANKKIVRVQFTRTANANPTLFEAGTIYSAELAPTALANLVTPGVGLPAVVKFAGTNVANVAPEVAAVVPVDSTTIKVLFTKEVTGLAAGSFTLNGFTLTPAVSNTDIVKEAVFYLAPTAVAPAPQELAAGTIYNLTLADNGFYDAAGYIEGKNVDANAAALTKQFAGTNVKNAAPTVQAAVAVDEYNVDVIFSEPVNFTGNGTSLTLKKGEDAVTVAGIAADATDARKVRLTLSGANKLAAGTIYNVTVNNGVADKSGLAVAGLATGATYHTQFAGTNVKNAAPQIAGVAYDAATRVMTVIFSEALTNATAAASDFVITGAGFTADAADTYVVNGKTVTITLTNALTAGQIATIKASAINTLTDANGQKATETAVQVGIN